ncbi:hypothetical protein EDD27_2953 [Nonomuraea polychroma]|uniref:Serine/threonine protein kinase n=1 Tax=Nonomuraea polychroma TaxID=46176 RepID=A0A438M471_9ACTN|nr:hypothetical protein [Nonomuraea polychroma]RVX40542.1 hypothetical protein EDD27_2953 [Nonomuraea polychroma]
MSRSGPILTLLAGMVTTAALASLSLAELPPPPSGGTTSASVRDPAAEAQDPAPTPTGSASEEDPAAEPRDPAPTPTGSASAAAPAAAVVRADYATRVRGSRGLLAISVRGGKAIAYFCDGRTEAWFQGTATGGILTLDGFGGAGVSAELADGRAIGELSIGDQRWDFTAPTVRRPSGLYRATAQVRGAKLVAGWIYLPDGSRVGAVTLDGALIAAEIPEPGQATVIKGAVITPEDVDAFMGEL